VLAYDKMHLCDMGACSEVAYGIARGTEPGVFDCRGYSVGLTICYDLRFPELHRHLSWDRDCDLILHPAAFVRDATFPCYHQFVTTRAVENGVYMLSVNYAGDEFGASIAVPPWIGPVPGLESELASTSLETEEGVLPLTVEPGHLEAVRRAYPYRRDVSTTLRERRST
jgi:predicted amidohydrolase